MTTSHCLGRIAVLSYARCIASQIAELFEACLAHVQQPTFAPLPEALVPHTAKLRSKLSHAHLSLLRTVELSTHKWDS